MSYKYVFCTIIGTVCICMISYKPECLCKCALYVLCPKVRVLNVPGVIHTVKVCVWPEIRYTFGSCHAGRHRSMSECPYPRPSQLAAVYCHCTRVRRQSITASSRQATRWCSCCHGTTVTLATSSYRPRHPDDNKQQENTGKT